MRGSLTGLPAVGGRDGEDAVRHDRATAAGVAGGRVNEPGDPGVPGRTFVGRARELAELRAAIADAGAGRGRLVLIAGAAGIGKTRLAGELQVLAEAAGMQASWARCWDGGGAPAFWPWTVLLRPLLASTDAAAVAARLGLAAAPLVHLVPELRAQRTPVPAPPPPGAFDSERARFPLFDAVARVLRELAQDRPLLLLFDDLHAADEASLLLLRFVARDLHGARLLIAATLRERDPDIDPATAQLLARLGRAGTHLPLAGWSEEETAQFVTAASGTAPPPGFIARLQELTEGNPFFVDEIVRLRLAAGGGRLPPAPGGPLPGSIRATIEEHLRRLPAASREALELAAVIGREFDFAVLRAALEVDAAALLAALAPAQAAGVVSERQAAPRFAFAHALIRETLYTGLAEDVRRRAHARIGAALEQLTAGDCEPHLDALAHHFAQAAPAGTAAQAVTYAVRAAEHAATMFAFEAAEHHLERALQLQALLPAPEARATLLLRLQLGEMQGAAWALERARATFIAAADQARRLGEREAFARAALGVAGLGFGVPRGTVDAGIVALLEEALAGLDADSALWARVAARLAVELHFSAEAERRDVLSRAAIDTARRGGDTATLAAVLSARHFAVWDSAEVEERLALAAEGVQLADACGDVDLGLQHRVWRLVDLWEIGDVTTFDREFDIFARRAEARRTPKFLGFAAALRGLRALWAGRFEDAIALSQAAMALGERVGDRANFASVAVQIFVARRAQDRLAEIEPLVRLWAERTPALAASRCLLAILCADLEHTAEARLAYEHLVADDLVSLQCRNALVPLLPYLAELCVQFRDTRRAPLLYRHLLGLAGRNLGLGPNVVFGPASHSLAVLADLLGQHAEAERHFTRAAEEATRAQAPPWLAAIQLDHGAALLARGEAGRAAPLLQSAAEIATALGMARISARLARLPRPPAVEADAATTALAAGGEGGSIAGPSAGREGPRRVVPFPARPAARAAARAPAEGQFRREGEYWTIGIGTDVVRLRDTSGLRYLAELLRRPGVDVPAVTLASTLQAPPDTGPAHADAAAHQAGLTAAEHGGSEGLLDAQARAAYTRQLAGLREQLDEARAHNDAGRIEALEREIAFLSRELARAVGLDGRDRPGSTRAERARLNVTRAIRAAIRRLAGASRDLGLYFETTIRTGTFCSFTPDPRLPVRWSF